VTRKQRRAALIGMALSILVVASMLVLVALRDTIVFFHAPSDVIAKSIPAGQRFRLGGLVATGSLQRGAGTVVQFSVTDTLKAIPVSYSGVLPDLFREGQGVVAEGALDASGRFLADTVLAKHDETYMPPDVAKALKEKGVWQGAAAEPRGTSGAGNPTHPDPSAAGIAKQ
jgi:cytochrome c-type biogenesis protein CcmE